LYNNNYLKIFKWYIIRYIAAIVIIAAVKFYHYVCIDHKDYITLNPSGHMGLAIVVYSPVFFLLQNISNEYSRLIIKFITIICLCLIGMSRYLLRYHSIDEVIVGAMIGILVSFNILLSVIDIRRDIIFSRSIIYIFICPALAISLYSNFSSENIIQLLARKAGVILDCI